MLAIALIAVGVVLMLVGVITLAAWVSGKSSWFDAGVYDRQGETKTDRQYLDLYFVALVIAPLLVGALLIVLGLQQLQ